MSEALAVLAVDPGLGARWRGGAEPLRDRFLAGLVALVPACRRIAPGISDDRLLGGLDLAATLSGGRRAFESGVLAAADGGVVVLAMAERCEAGLAARLAQTLDRGEVVAERDGCRARQDARVGLVLLDEGLEDEAPPAALLDRAGLWLLPEACRVPSSAEIAAARACLPGVAVDDGAVRALCAAAASFGVASLRAPLLALRAARAHAALAGRGGVEEADLAFAAATVLGPRATMLPASDEAEAPAETRDDQGGDAAESGEAGRLQDVVLEAARAALPPELLAALAGGRAGRGGARGRAGIARKAPSHGRMVGARPGRPGGTKRLAVLQTLRAAAPWQAVRRRERPEGPRIRIRRDDFRVQVLRAPARRTTIFLVDASGSAALARLAEAKGAALLLLGDCYVRRDRVALLAMRGTGAELLLPPTSSLVRARKSLSALPGGGGTPLAAGLDAAHLLARQVARSGLAPALVLLTDGRANVARDGAPGRARAAEEARQAARAWRETGFAAVLLDISARPGAEAAALAREMGATFLALPYADARRMSGAVQAALAG